ncbi:hypothetical protein [Streptomyces sp. DH12]|uniref:hypothetical protein n=1 Tax=Streptomyces sp. DH12 TaxID=2857010 RepID=UPI001E3BE575|nr:hypothetical protein [Streptomyces sp. DH12]
MQNEPLYQPWGRVSATFWDRPGSLVDVQPRSTRVPTTTVQVPKAAPKPEHSPGDATELTAANTAPDIPEAYRDGILFVTSTFSSKDPETLQRAVVEAERLNEAMTAEYGERDVRTISVREMRGWLAHLMGHNAVAAAWYLHTAGLLSALLGNGDQRTRDSARRGVTTWLAITDPSAAASLAPAVLAMAVAIDGEGSKVVQLLRQRMKSAVSSRDALAS